MDSDGAYNSSIEIDGGSGEYDNQLRPRRHERPASGHRYVKRQSSEPPADYDLEDGDAGLSGHQAPGQSYIPSTSRQEEFHPLDSIELHRMEDGGAQHCSPRRDGNLWARDEDWHHQLKHRRAKSQHANGFDYYRQLHHHVNHGFSEHDQDRLSLRSLNMEDLREARQLLATIRIRRRNRDGSSRKNTSFRDGVDSETGDAAEEYEEVGMPSARQKMKGLTERLLLAKQLQSTSDVAREYRDTIHASEAEGLSLYPKKIAKGFKSASESLSDLWYRINFWSQQFKEIEGHFGIATTTYFRFARWLIKINFMVFFLFLCFVYIPQLSHDSIFRDTYVGPVNSSQTYTEKAFRCSEEYTEYVNNRTEDEDALSVFSDIAQGRGHLEQSMLFYGYYSNLTFWISGAEGKQFEVKYNMGLGYLLTVGLSFLIVFIMIVRNSSRTVRETVMDFDNKAFPLYTNAVFGGWDYCINREKTAFFKHKIVFNELKATLEEVEFKRRRENRSTRERTRLYLKRFIINLIVLAILVVSFYAIFITTDFLIEKQTEDLSEIVFLLISYLPSIVISVLNVVIPEVFLVLSDLEEYTHSFATHITIIRAVFLRLSSVGVLIVSLYVRLQYQENRPQIACPEEYRYNATKTKCCGNILWQSDIENDSSGRGTVKCWETYVGQQFYKLAIADFLSVVLVALLVKIPRRFIYHQLKDKVWIVAKLGLAKFDLPIQVLDILYTQTLCWMGMFFTPLYPAISCVKVFIYFFLKKFELVSLSDPPVNAYRGSRSYSFFQTVLLVSFIMISGLLGYMIGNFQPSMSCGPFRIYSSSDYVMFDVLSNEVNSWPDVPKGIVKFFGTVAFFLPAFLVLLLGIYYYWAITSGYKKMEELLKVQLKSEAHDKQYLLARVDEIIKRGELNPEDYR